MYLSYTSIHTHEESLLMHPLCHMSHDSRAMYVCIDSSTKKEYPKGLLRPFDILKGLFCNKINLPPPINVGKREDTTAFSGCFCVREKVKRVENSSTTHLPLLYKVPKTPPQRACLIAMATSFSL